MANVVPIELTVNQITQNLTAAIASETSRTMLLAGQNFIDVVNLFRKKATAGDEIARVNSAIAAKMRTAVVSAYESNVIAVRSAPTYRKGDNRYAGGALLRALESPTMAIGSAEGIAFVDVPLLDRTARHWARLNFGAGAAEGRSGVSFRQPNARIQFGSNQGVSLRFTNPPRPNFKVPQQGFGYFNKQGQLFLGRPPKKRGRGSEVTVVGGFPEGKPSVSGIAPRRFLDAGLVALGKNFGRMYKEHFADAARAAASKKSARF